MAQQIKRTPFENGNKLNGTDDSLSKFFHLDLLVFKTEQSNFQK